VRLARDDAAQRRRDEPVARDRPDLGVGNRPAPPAAPAPLPLPYGLAGGGMDEERGNVEALFVHDAARDVRHGDDLRPCLRVEQARQVSAHVAESLDDYATVLERDPEIASV